MGYIKNNYDSLLAEIKRLGGDREITLVAVTKSGTDEELVELVRAGAVDIGENRPQELARRGTLLKENGFTPRLHEIGHLQKNKVSKIIDSVALIHSLDNMSLALEIEKQAAKVGRMVPVLIEVNSAKEEAKGGLMPEEVVDFYLKIRELPHLVVSGLMTMGPVCEEKEDIRKYFKSTKELFDKIAKKYGWDGVPTLSMGMSDSYDIAIEEGATLVRVGRRLFIDKERENV